MASDGRKKKIAVLGGGMASLSAAYYLTNRPDWRDEYDVTVYQMGWRLGGKCASGRNVRPEKHKRIEEHGIHGFCGWYNNAFRMLREAYATLDKIPPMPGQSRMPLVGSSGPPPHNEALLPENFLFMMERVGEEWEPWPMEFPSNPSVPGEGSGVPSAKDYVSMIFQLVASQFRVAFEVQEALRLDPTPASGGLIGRVETWLRHVVSDVEVVGAGLETAVLETVKLAVEAFVEHDPSTHGRASEALTHLRDLLRHHFERYLETHRNLRRTFVLADLFTSILIGALRDRVWPDRYQTIDGLDFRDWLRSHGALEVTVTSPLVLNFYNIIFANPRGDTTVPGKVAAGSLLHFILRTNFAYNGSLFFKMNAGTAEVIVTPLYEVLVARGVRFEFFHCLRGITLSADTSRLDTITLGVQATVKKLEVGYQPLFVVNQLGCWPSEPFYDQLVQGDELRAIRDQFHCDLESMWVPWPDVARRELRAGEDFDQVVLGIPIAEVERVCPALKAKPAWAKMFASIQTVQTLAMQLWLKPSLQGLGWRIPLRGTECPVQDTYQNPFSAWASFSHLIRREEWGNDEARPHNLAYFCGVLEEVAHVPGADDALFPARERERVRWTAIQWLRDNVRRLWPNAGNPPAEPDSLDWNLLADSQNRTGTERFNDQYWRANIDPAERYTLSVPGSTQYRLKPWDTGVDNLAICGDWTDNGINVGCVEATVVSGMLASHAVSGFPRPEDIYGWTGGGRS